MFGQIWMLLLIISGPQLVPCVDGQQKHQIAVSVQPKVISTPINDETVRQALSRIQDEVKDAPSLRDLAKRNLYISELISVLERCDRQDRFRLDAQRIPTEGVQVRISDRTAARVIRCLGDLQAKEAAGVITEFLLLPWDVPHYSALPREGDMPAQWALFQIGDAALPHLRKKMASEVLWIRRCASLVAESILGPRASIQLEEWIRNAKTPEEQSRLAEMRRKFEGFARDHQKYNSLEQYRAERLEKGRNRLKTVLDSATLDEAATDFRDRPKN